MFYLLIVKAQNFLNLMKINYLVEDYLYTYIIYKFISCIKHSDI